MGAATPYRSALLCSALRSVAPIRMSVKPPFRWRPVPPSTGGPPSIPTCKNSTLRRSPGTRSRRHSVLSYPKKLPTAASGRGPGASGGDVLADQRPRAVAHGQSTAHPRPRPARSQPGSATRARNDVPKARFPPPKTVPSAPRMRIRCAKGTVSRRRNDAFGTTKQLRLRTGARHRLVGVVASPLRVNRIGAPTRPPATLLALAVGQQGSERVRSPVPLAHPVSKP